MRRSVILILTIAFVLIGVYFRNESFFEQTQTQTNTQTSADSVSNAYKNKQSDIQVQGSGTVVAVLKDDTRGTRHQRFILRLSDDMTLLVSHNIDLSQRIDGLKKGDSVDFFGEYEWNEKGGVVHWTHRDPAGKHVDGWLKHENRMYR